MPIDVNALITDAQLDDFVGKQIYTGQKLLPKGWTDTEPARQFALDEVLRLFATATPPIAETDIVDVSVLAHAVKLGGASRIYFLAMSKTSESALFYSLYKSYEKSFDTEVRKQVDAAHKGMAPDPKGRGRRSISIVRR